jgi:SecD/SecF fusion protein
MDRSDIESINIVTGKDPQDHRIQIKLKPAAISVFADATKNNLNKSIAIVIDNKVYSWPVVRNVIEGGEIEVSGSFTEKEVNYFPALFNSEQLPLNFKLLK